MGSLSWRQQLALKEYMAKYTEKYMAKEEYVEECMVECIETHMALHAVRVGVCVQVSSVDAVSCSQWVTPADLGIY